MERPLRLFPRIVVLTAGLGVALAVVALVAQLAFGTSTDPTEQGVTITLRNDTTAAMLVKRCADGCERFHETDRLRPGEEVRVNVSRELATAWQVSAAGTTRGCLRLPTGAASPGTVLNVSRAAGCPQPGGDDDLLGAIIAYALFVAAGAVGVASVVFGTMAAHRRIVRTRLRDAQAALATAVAAIFVFFGGWLLFDLYVVYTEVARASSHDDRTHVIHHSKSMCPSGCSPGRETFGPLRGSGNH